MAGKQQRTVSVLVGDAQNAVNEMYSHWRGVQSLLSTINESHTFSQQYLTELSRLGKAMEGHKVTALDALNQLQDFASAYSDHLAEMQDANTDPSTGE